MLLQIMRKCMFVSSLTLSWLLDHAWLLVDWFLVGRLWFLMEDLHCISLGKYLAFSCFGAGQHGGLLLLPLLAKLFDDLGASIGIDVLRMV